MTQQKMCWFCGRAEKDCDYLMQSPLRPVVFNLSAKATEGFATGTISLEGKAHAYICEDCARTSRSMIAEERRDPGRGYENRKGGAAANNPACQTGSVPEHKE